MSYSNVINIPSSGGAAAKNIQTDNLVWDKDTIQQIGSYFLKFQGDNGIRLLGVGANDSTAFDLRPSIDVSANNPGETISASQITNRKLGHLVADIFANDIHDAFAVRTDPGLTGNTVTDIGFRVHADNRIIQKLIEGPIAGSRLKNSEYNIYLENGQLTAYGRDAASALKNLLFKGSNITNSDLSLTDNRTLTIPQGKVLTFDASSNSTAVGFRLLGREVYAGLTPYLNFVSGDGGGLDILSSRGVGAIRVFSGHPSSQPQIFNVGRFGGGYLIGGEVQIGSGLNNASIKVGSPNISFYRTTGQEMHRIGTSTGSGNVQVEFFRDGFPASFLGKFRIGGSSQVAEEDILLKGDTHIGGELIIEAITAPVADSHLIDDSFAFHVDGGVLKARYKDALSVVSDLVIGSGLVKDEGSATVLEATWNGNTSYPYSIPVAGAVKGDTFNVYLDDDVFVEITSASAEDNSYAYCNVDGTVEVVCRVTSFITIPASSTIKVKNIK